MIKDKNYTVRMQIRVRPIQKKWMESLPENYSVIMRRLIDDEMARQEKNKT